MIETILIAILRKLIFMGMLFGVFRLIDIFYLKAFDTDEVIKDDPKAIAIIIAGIALALAFA
jgi:hypothetical protein